MELRESEKDREFIKVANSIIIRWKANGCIEFINDFGLKTFGYTKEELIGKNVNILVPKTESNGKDLGNLVKDIAAHPESYSLNENENIKKNGERIWIIWTNQAIKDEEGKVKEILAIGNDITRIKRQSNELRLSLEVLNLFNRADKSIDAVSAVLFLIKQSIGFDAVGIRLSEGEDFPYYVTNGFPGHFLEKERYLCQRDEMGKIVRDALGNPILECMCGNVISGRIDASLPFFTEGGSFWTNSTTDLLASTREKERQGRTRNRCNGEGYESVALIPIKSGKDIIGLLQLNDRRRGQLNKEMVNFFESLGSSIGSLLSQKKTEELLRQEHQRFQELFDNMSSGVAVYTVKDDGKDFIIKDINKSGEHSSKVIRDEIVGKSLLQVFPGVEKIGLFKVFQEVWRNGKPQRHPVSLYKDERMFQWVENYVYKLPSGEIV
ncbi:MAG TPA: PAS domain S-box protein, partial [Candidatus Margulisiibacteriota bacterium]|nr:PAS domain S-box protein [Candidatus Margulisiibacteriota bacterium]